MKQRVIMLTKCPKCGATCRVGHDEDMQVFCANCTTSFGYEIDDIELVTSDEYQERKSSAKKVFERSSWEAFIP